MRNGIDTPHVNVIYPSGLATNVGGGRAAYFSIPRPTIYIPDGRIDWHTLYHEYGHHIGMKLGIDDHPAQNLELHMGWPPLVFDLDYNNSMFNSTQYSSYSKSQHIRITWAEAYAYYLSMMIRHFYLEDFNGIPASSYVRIFSITGGVDEGEASVPAIQSVLWCTYKDILNAGRNIDDIVTGSSETKIAIKNTHKVMWNILSNSQTNSTIKSYSAYANYFTNNYPEYRSEFGRISAIHGMSPKNVTFSTYSESESPTISWQNSFVSTNYKVNNYSLVFYDNSNEEILRINNINTTSHKLSNDDWEQVKNNFGNGDHVNIHVMAFQTNTPTTGGFISQAFKLSHLIYISINNGGAYSITGILNKQFTGSIDILDEYQGTPVTQISDSAFENCTSLTNINLPNSLTSIGNSAFKGCISLSSIAIPNSVTSIGQNAFSGCDSLIINWNNTTINIKTANINTTYIGALSIVNKYYWYEYIAPSSGEYSFKTTGTTDTYGELFTNMIYDDSTTGRITYDNNSGDGNNFLINHHLNTGQKVYLRVRGANPNVSGNFGFNINKIEHFHSYDIYDNYYDNLGHRVACICGHSIKEAHDTIIISGKYYCTICPWVGKNVIIIPEQFEDIFSVRFLDESKQRKMNLEETSIYNKKKKEAID